MCEACGSPDSIDIYSVRWLAIIAWNDMKMMNQHRQAGIGVLACRFSIRTRCCIMQETNYTVYWPRLTSLFPPTRLGSENLLAQEHIFIIALFLFESRHGGISCLAKRANAILLKKQTFFCLLLSAQRDDNPRPFFLRHKQDYQIGKKPFIFHKTSQTKISKPKRPRPICHASFMLLNPQFCPIAVKRTTAKVVTRRNPVEGLLSTNTLN